MATRRFYSLPEFARVPVLLRETDDLWNNGRLLDPAIVLANRNWSMLLRDFGPRSQVDSLLIPQRGGKFGVAINRRRAPSAPFAQWLIAHELAHAMFYDRADPPQRMFRWTPNEERFCDRFADEYQLGLTRSMVGAA